jgi:predicted nucleotidyltransferase
MYQDFKDLLSAFHAHGVKYLIVGGYAVSFHGQPRATKDIDLFIKADPTNAQAAYAAQIAFGAPLADFSVDDLADPRQFIRFGREPVAIDILPGIDGVDFDAAWERRVEAVIDIDSGLKAFIISKDDLIASKLAAGRLRDLADVEELREAGDIRETTDSAAPPNATKKPPETHSGDPGQ